MVGRSAAFNRPDADDRFFLLHFITDCIFSGLSSVITSGHLEYSLHIQCVQRKKANKSNDNDQTKLKSVLSFHSFSGSCDLNRLLFFESP